MHVIKLASSPDDVVAVKAIFEEYLTVLKTDFDNKIGCAIGSNDLQTFPKQYLGLFLATLNDTPLAACGVKHINVGDCELSKLYCKPEGRGHGLGRTLTEAAILYARQNGYKRLVLSTESVMEHAIQLYENIGFASTDKYESGQSGCSRFMAFSL
ncbi:MAG: GNAT family N-acetyltransferase [Robiginitomaculum sp.]|nr:GNAT family N-acetyltransferase [Robiginitomaculum sp.]